MLYRLGENDLAKAFVCAMPAENMARPRYFRTYRVCEGVSPNYVIWEAARATTVASTIFKRISIGEEVHAIEEFINGNIRCNNPAMRVIEEARSIFGDNSNLGCLVSIGTVSRGHWRNETRQLPKAASFGPC
jgi:patatin-like phospholipase/acyl hydrolase